MGRNLSTPALTWQQIVKLPHNTTIIDGNMDLYTKRTDLMWESETGLMVTSTALVRPRHQPLKLWLARKGNCA